MATKPKDKPARLSEADNLRRENFALRKAIIERSLDDFAREHDAFWKSIAERYGIALGADEIAQDGAIMRRDKAVAQQADTATVKR